MEFNTIVNENDDIIWYKERKDILEEDIYRVAALLIINSNNQILLAQRSLNKKLWPWLWWVSVTGTLAWDESYEDCIIRETEEELWIKITKPQKLDKIRMKWRFDNNYFTQWFKIEMDLDIKDLVICQEEVEQVKWFSKEEIINNISNNPDSFTDWLIYFIKNLNY